MNGEKHPGKFRTEWLLPVLAMLAAVAALSPVLGNGFTTWDDPQYILDNPLIRNLSPASVVAIFTTPEFAGNYHPLTLLLYAAEYTLFGTGAAGYHLVSLLLHIGVVVVVYAFARRLSGSAAAAFVAALLFAVHPLHVEPVAWASDQKDLLFSLLYLGGLTAYLRAVDTGDRRLLWYAVLPLFVLSLLSKGLAVTFPLVLLLIDGYRGRAIGRESLPEKAPFFLLSLVFGVGAMVAQSAAGAVTDLGYDGPLDKLLTASTGYIIYIVRMVWPDGLSPYYPYPSDIPPWRWMLIPAAIAVPAAAYLTRKRIPALWFGVAFFTVTLLPVLQLVPVGNAMMADRYAYLPSAGLLLPAGLGAARALRFGVGKRGLAAGAAIAVCSLLLIFKARTTCAVWENGVTLWDRVVLLYPELPKGYFNRGYAWHELGDPARAVEEYDRVLELAPDYPYAHFNRAVSRTELGLNDEALADFDVALRTIRDDPAVFTRRGMLYQSLAMHARAVADFDSALSLEPRNAPALAARGLSRMETGDLDAALEDYTGAVGADPANPDIRFNRGNVLAALKRYDAAIDEFTAVLRLSPGDGEALFRRGIVRLLGGDRTAACEDFREASERGFGDAAAALASYCR